MKKIAVIILIALAVHLPGQIIVVDQSYKQVLGATKDQLAAVKTRKLAVIIQEPNKERMESKEMKKNLEEADRIKKYFDEINSYLKEVVPQYWTYTKNVEFITQEKAASLAESGNKDYAVMGIVFNSPTTSVRTYLQTPEIGNQMEKYGMHTTKMTNQNWDYKNGHTKLFVKPIELLKVHTSHFEIPFADLIPTKADVIMAVHCLKQMFEEGKELSEVKRNKEIERTKTLLINKDWAPKLDDETIKKSYPNQYKLVSAEEYNSLVASKDKQYCALVSIPHLWNITKSNSSANNMVELHYMSVVIDLETGKVINFDDKGEALFGSTARIDKKVLKSVAE